MRWVAGDLLKKSLDDAGLAGAGEAGDKNIEARFVNAEAEFDGANRAVLTDKIFQRRHLRRARER